MPATIILGWPAIMPPVGRIIPCMGPLGPTMPPTVLTIVLGPFGICWDMMAWGPGPPMPGPMFIPGLMPGPAIMLGPGDMEDTTAGSELGWLTCAWPELATSLPCCPDIGPPMEVIEVSLILLLGAFPAKALTSVMFWLPGFAIVPIWFMVMPPGPPGPGLIPMFA